jgi:hypothetical protein
MSFAPSSFATVCTSPLKQELFGFLLSLSLHHRNAEVYINCDSASRDYINECTPKIRLNITWIVSLDKYSTFTRQEMENQGIWGDFQMAKAEVIREALQKENDVLFIDCDTVILDKFEIPEGEYQLGVSPQFITDIHVELTGYYNGGLLWTNQISLPDKWISYTAVSRYYDQASIEDLAKDYKYFEFGENYNLQTWRFILGKESSEQIKSYFNIKDGTVFYKTAPLKFIHMHFSNKEAPQLESIKNFIVNILLSAKKWKELAIIFRIVYDKWQLIVPEQPRRNPLFNHTDDSYRELALMFQEKNMDLKVLKCDTNHCWLYPKILLYDRPTLGWYDNEAKSAFVAFHGNGDGDVGEPWIFWPRNPRILEPILEKHGTLPWSERTNLSIFIGNIENSVQDKYRKKPDWKDYITEFHCTYGKKHLFTQEEYLMKLRSSKYGLCLRGYGSKCHREVELMAFGVVPIITENVSITSYYDPPILDMHYIYVKSPEEINEKLEKISEEKWTQMSTACKEWYQRNVHSDNAWANMISHMLYET